MRIAVAEDKRIVMYPCRRSEMLNFVCIHPDTSRSGASEEEWNTNSTVATLTAVYSDFDPIFLRLFGFLKDVDVKLWQLKDRGPMETWIRGNACLLGDACHPMMPHQGQGGGQAIEDGAALGALFPLGIAPVDVPGRLKLYEHVRKARAESIQEFSRSFMMGKTSSMNVSRKSFFVLAVRKNRLTDVWWVVAAQVHAFTFGHDVVAYAKESMTAIFIPPANPPQRMSQGPPRSPGLGTPRGPSPAPRGPSPALRVASPALGLR